MNRFEFDAVGTLRHFINGELRAVVSPENVVAYRESQSAVPAGSVVIIEGENHGQA